VKFNVIIGNPPYQRKDGGHGVSSSPLYHEFILQAKRLSPDYISMLVPSRWFSGGKGLDSFRKEMLNDKRLSVIHDYPDAKALFPGVQIKGGICHFLFDLHHNGDCCVHSYNKDGDKISVMKRPLLETGLTTFIRYNEAVSIYRKVKHDIEKGVVAEHISARIPFGLFTMFKGEESPTQPGMIKIYQNGGVGYASPDIITHKQEWINKYKVLIPRAGSGSDSFPHRILGTPFWVEPGSACTETYMVAGTFDNQKEAENLVSYMKTRFFRFMVLLKKTTQDASLKVYQLTPRQTYLEPWTDDKLQKRYNLTDEEMNFISQCVKPMN
jgi:site-specific DNA-methyltransferase (adenine-specific)